MSTPKVTIVDYGIGNLFSVQRALEACGCDVSLASDADEIDAAERLVLPGVGAFADGMRGLRERGLVEPLQRYAAADRPLLGICLGMQMLATVSQEFGEHAGLELIPGRVVAVPKNDTELGRRLKIPHIGWSALLPAGGVDWRETPLRTIPPSSFVYLVHSFHMRPDAPRDLLAVCEYGGHKITAVVRRGRILGCQFHPEKSGEIGLAILKAFVDA